MNDRGEATALIGQTAHHWAQTLTGLVKARGRVHLLLNRLNGLHERLTEQVGSLRDTSPLNDPYFGDAIERTPLLAALTMAELPLLDLSAELAAQAALDPALPAPPVYGWMCADTDTPRLAGHLRRQLDLRLEGRRNSVFFCYLDPRVMPRLPRVLAPAQLARLFGPVELWVVPGRNGQLFGIHKPQAHPEPPGPGGLSLAREQAEALDRLVVVNAAVRRLHAQALRVPQPDDDARLDVFVSQARALGLAQPTDQAAYAALAYAWAAERGPIDTDPWLQRGIELARTGVPLAIYVQQSPSTLLDKP